MIKKIVFKIKLLSTNEYLQGGFFLTATTFLSNIVNYFFNFLAGRYLGPQGYSEITSLFSYTYIFSVPMAVLSAVIIQKIGSSGKEGFERAKGLETFFWNKVFKLWFLIIPIILITPFLSTITNISEVTALFFFPYIFLSFLNSFYGSTLQGLKMFLPFAIVGLISVLIKVVGPVLGIFMETNLQIILFFLVLSLLLGLILSIKFFKDNLKKIKIKKEISINKRFTNIVFSRQILITTISLFGISLLNNLDIIFTKKFFLAYDAGLYGVWSLFGRIIFYVLGPIITVAFISFTDKKNNLKNGKKSWLWLFAFFVLIIGSYFFYNILSVFLIKILFGSEYIQIAKYLGLSAIFGSLYTLIVFLNNYFIAKNDFRCMIITFLFPIYLLGLFLINKNIESLINLNIIFSSLVAVAYLYLVVKKE